jgi:hypothetical protein
MCEINGLDNRMCGERISHIFEGIVKMRGGGREATGRFHKASCCGFIFMIYSTLTETKLC